MSKHSMYPPAAMRAGKPYTPNPGSHGAFSTRCAQCSQCISPAATAKLMRLNVCADRVGCATRRKATSTTSTPA